MKPQTLLGAFIAAAFCAPASAVFSAEQLAKLAQNPIANLVSVPFQNNTNFNVGPQNGTQVILNIQPVVPFELNKDWNLITRTIIPLIWQPGFAAGQGTEFGMGDIQHSLLASPAAPSADGLIWGAGAIMQLPTDTNGLGNRNWGLGPTAVALHLKPGYPWVYGALVNNDWLVSSDGQGGGYYNVVHPDDGDNWQLRFQVSFMFPK